MQGARTGVRPGSSDNEDNGGGPARRRRRRRRRDSCCLCCASYEATVPSLGHPAQPRGAFRPNFRSRASVVLPARATLAEARRRLFDAALAEAVVLLSPTAANFRVIDVSKAAAWLVGGAGGGRGPGGDGGGGGGGGGSGTEMAAEQMQMQRFSFEVTVPLLFGGLFTRRVRVDACQREVETDAQGAFELVMECMAAPGQVYLRRRRRISMAGGKVHVDELVEGRCHPLLRHLAERETKKMHRRHVKALQSLFAYSAGTAAAPAAAKAQVQGPSS